MGDVREVARDRTKRCWLSVVIRYHHLSGFQSPGTSSPVNLYVPSSWTFRCRNAIQRVVFPDPEGPERRDHFLPLVYLKTDSIKGLQIPAGVFHRCLFTSVMTRERHDSTRHSVVGYWRYRPGLLDAQSNLSGMPLSPEEAIAPKTSSESWQYKGGLAGDSPDEYWEAQLS